MAVTLTDAQINIKLRVDDSELKKTDARGKRAKVVREARGVRGAGEDALTARERIKLTKQKGRGGSIAGAFAARAIARGASVVGLGGAVGAARAVASASVLGVAVGVVTQADFLSGLLGAAEGETDLKKLLAEEAGKALQDFREEIAATIAFAKSQVVGAKAAFDLATGIGLEQERISDIPGLNLFGIGLGEAQQSFAIRNRALAQLERAQKRRLRQAQGATLRNLGPAFFTQLIEADKKQRAIEAAANAASNGDVAESRKRFKEMMQSGDWSR